MLGIGSIRKAAKVGKVGGSRSATSSRCRRSRWRSAWSSATSSSPGAGLHLEGRARLPGYRRRRARCDFLLGIIPTTLVSALTGESAADAVRRPARRASRLQAMGRRASRSCAVWAHPELVFRILAMIMWAAPVGAFGAIAGGGRRDRGGRAGALASIMSASTSPARCSCSSCSARCCGSVDRRQHPVAAALPRPGVPADRVDVVVGVGAAAADREDGAPGRLTPGRRHHRPDRLLVQPRRHRDLPDDGVAVRRRGDGHAARDRRADLAAASS